MDAKTIEFFALAAISVLSVAAGYISRERGWLDEDMSRKLHWFTIVVLWSLAGFFALWNLDPNPSNFWVVIIEPLLVVIPAFLIIPLAKAIKLKGNQIGVLALAAGLRNSGFALGAYLAYAILPAGELLRQQGQMGPAQIEAQAISVLAYGLLIVMTMSMAVVIFLFPLVQHFAGTGEGVSLGRIIYKSFVDWKAMLFYSSAAGIALAYLRVPVPTTIIFDWYLLKILIFIGSATAYFGIGLRLHVNHLRPHLKSHVLVGAVKFIATPALTVGLLLIASNVGLTPPARLLQQTFILLAFMPTAIQTVIVANLFHLDARMAGSIWIVNMMAFLLLVLPTILFVVPRI